jgi:hypothetical protein
MQNKKSNRPWRKLLGVLISVTLFVIPHSFEVQWSKEQTAVIIQK